MRGVSPALIRRARHAHYDDTHPWEALEIVCSLIGNRAEPKYVELLKRCICNSYRYMAMSLDHCLLGSVPQRRATLPTGT